MSWIDQHPEFKNVQHLHDDGRIHDSAVEEETR